MGKHLKVMTSERQGNAKRTGSVDEKHSGDSTLYLSPNELADRWHCSRTTAQRIARRAGLTRLYLGNGKNGIVRYIRMEVEAYEESRKVKVRAPCLSDGTG